MQKLIKGVHAFEKEVFLEKRALFQGLASRQEPAAMFITCSDSRINPNLLTQTEPGDLFVLRNAGNIVPKFPGHGGEIATIEFAVRTLNIRDIVICGHSDCGAMKGLLDLKRTSESMPVVSRWLAHAAGAIETLEESYGHLQGADRLAATVEANVLVQIENLRSHRLIDELLRSGELRLHGWVYTFETGQVTSFDAAHNKFLPLTSAEKLRPVYPSGAHFENFSSGEGG